MKIVLRSRSVSCILMAALLLTSCAKLKRLVGMDVPLRSILPRAETQKDGSVKLVLEAGVRATVSFLFFADLREEGGQARVKILDWGGRKELRKPVLTRDGEFPESARIEVERDRELAFRIAVEYRSPEDGAWRRMTVNDPIRPDQWKQFMPPGRLESGVIRWRVGDSLLNGSVGVKLRVALDG